MFLALLSRPEMDGPETATVPINEAITRSAGHVDYQASVLGGGRIGDEGEACHLWLHHNRVPVVESDQDSLCDAIHSNDSRATHSSMPIDRRRGHLDRPIGDLRKLDAGDGTTDRRHQSTPHGFHFG